MPRPRADIYVVVEHARDPVANCESQAETFFIQAAGIVQPVEFLENGFHFRFVYTDSGIPYADF